MTFVTPETARIGLSNERVDPVVRRDVVMSDNTLLELLGTARFSVINKRPGPNPTCRCVLCGSVGRLEYYSQWLFLRKEMDQATKVPYERFHDNVCSRCNDDLKKACTPEMVDQRVAFIRYIGDWGLDTTWEIVQANVYERQYTRKD